MLAALHMPSKQALILAALAAARFKRFQDPITLQLVPRSQGIMLNKQMYSKKSIQNMIDRGNARIPHSRRQMTNDEIRGYGLRPPVRRPSGSASATAAELRAFYERHLPIGAPVTISSRPRSRRMPRAPPSSPRNFL